MRWDIDPLLFTLGPISIRWYGLFFAAGLLLGFRALARAFARRGFPAEDAHALMLWVPIGALIGAHLIHLVFYEPRSFWENPIRIVQLGLGLASHGGGLGAILGLLFVCRRKRVPFHRYADPAVAGAVWIIPLVRLGNFFNSEIYGRVTDLPWGVIFVRRGFSQPRHPSQIYEAVIGFALVGLAQVIEQRVLRRRLPLGVAFYGILGVYFISRVLVEFVKEYQVLDPRFPFTMGQLLSVPFIVLFGWMAIRRYRSGEFLPEKGSKRRRKV